MQPIRANILRICALLIVGLLLVGVIPSTVLGNSRTGTSPNQPATGYTEGQEKVEIYHQDQTHNTTFANGETVYIKVTTLLVTALPGNNNNNRVRVYDYQNTQVGNDYAPFFTKNPGGPPYIYEGSFVASNANGFTVADDYLVEVTLRAQGANQVRFIEVIHVGGNVADEKSIKVFGDAAYTTPATQFPPTSKVYVQVWAGTGTPDNTTSTVTLQNYQGVTAPSQISVLANPTITKSGNYARFVYDLSVDSGATVALNNAYWYTLSVTINDGNADLIVRWAVQFKINSTLANPPVVSQGATVANPNSITVGIQTTTISTTFTHVDKPAPGLFIITYKVKDPANAEYTLVDRATSGHGGLNVIQDAVDQTKYTASYVWNPAVNQPVGLYDLYFLVNDTVNKAEDAYVNNADELELKPPPAVPIIVAGSTAVKPAVIRAPGNDKTVISVNFTHNDAPSADSFKITFRVRDPGNTQITLVDAAQSGTSGLLVTKTGATSYFANYTWDPADNAILGPYDLFSRVEDANLASAEDGWGSNLDELTLTKDAALPVVVAGSTRVVPASINRTGIEYTIITTDFHHDDMPGIASFTISYMVRDEGGVNYTLVNGLKNGYGGLNIADLGLGNYKASFSWDPPENQPLGKYDLYFSVLDALSFKAIDPFEANPDELTITRKPSPPVMGAGVTTATPGTVNILGNETTTISTKFSHPDMPSLTTFKITFKVRDVGNQEYTLLNGATQGTPLLTVTTDTKGNYTADYLWDPPSVGQPLGSYDLYAGIEDLNGQKVMDSYQNNLEKLTLIKSTTPGNGTISGVVKDLKGKPISNATVKIYNATSGVVVKTLTTGADGTYTTTVPAGLYEVGTQAEDYKGETVPNLLVKQGQTLTVPDFKLIKTKGTGTGSETKEVIPTYIYGLIILLIVIIVLLCLFMLMKVGGKGTSEGQHEPKGPVHRHSVDDDDVSPDHPLEPKEEKEMESEPKPIPKDRIKIEKLKDEPNEPEE